jgi:hypothetical protein
MKQDPRDPQSAQAPTAVGLDAAEDVLGGGIRGEVAACPTGLASSPQAQAAQQPGGGGVPGTGAATTPPLSPDEGLREDAERSGHTE